MDTKKLRQKILDLAIHGKLVPQDPNDEPASVLLERIRAEKEQLIKEGKIKAPKKSKSAGDTSHYPKDVPFEVPKGWAWCQLKDVCSFLSRGKSPVYSDSYREYPVFAQKCNLKEGGISLEKALFLDPTTLSRWPEYYKLHDGDVLINSTGTGTVGRTRLFKSNCLGNYPFVVPDSHVSVIRTWETINSEFVLAVLSSEYGKHYIEENLAGSTNQKELYIGVLEDFLIPIPPRKEQGLIAKQIDSFNTAIKQIDNTKEHIDKAILAAKSKILYLAISGKLVPQNPFDEPAIEILKRINSSFQPSHNLHYDLVPLGWEECTLGDLVDIHNGYAFKSDEYSLSGIRVIRITNVQNGYLSDDDPKFFPEQRKTEVNKYMLEAGDLLISLTGNVGRVAFLDKKYLPAALNQRVACLRSRNQRVILEYLFYFIQNEQFVEDCMASGKGVAQLNISTEWLKKYPLLLPPIDEQKRILEQISRIFSILKEVSDTI